MPTRERHMRKSILLTAALLAACSQPDSRRESRDTRTFDAQQEPAEGAIPRSPPPLSQVRTMNAAADAMSESAGPNISMIAAPGVAFDYRYAYRLPNARIQTAQETH